MSDQTLSLDSFETFGDLLKYLRRREHLTQLELSIVVGYSEAQIGRLEKNQRRPDLTSLKALFIPALHLEDEPELIARFLELAQSSRQEDAPAPGIAPYKGLLFFDESDAELFFGREALTAHLVERVSDLSVDSSLRFLAVVGASGSGKSSLARAGLAVALQQAGWDVHIFTPGTDPCQTLEVQLELDQGQAESRRLLLLVDQFEETFTLCHNESERIGFTENLLSLAQDPSQKTAVVITLRADFYSHCAQYPLLREAVAAKQEYIGQMTARELRHAIEEPARRGGWVFEPGLVDVLLQDIGAHDSREPEPGALPLLSHALLATWEHRSGRTLTLKGYRASGGVRGAIAETAENIFHDQLNQAQQELARDVFLRLTELGEGTEDTRRRAALNELVAQSAEATQLRTVLNTLAEARLITLNEDSAEVSHEALIREWQRLHEWLTQDRDGLLLHRHLTESTYEWEERGRDSAELYRGARLAQVREWAAVNEERLNAPEQAFLAASIEHEQHETLEREAQRQRELEAAKELAETQSRAAKQLRRRAVFLTGAFVLAIVLAGLAIFFGDKANRNAAAAQANSKQAHVEGLIATSRELAAAAISSLDEDPERSILLALQAEATTHTPEAENALHHSILASRVVLVLRHDAEVWTVTFSPDGKYIATASQDGMGRIWDAKTGQLLMTLKGHTDSVNGIVYSPDGKRLATTSDDHTAKVWDAATGRELLTLVGHQNVVKRIAFSPDGNLLVTTSVDGTAKVWNALTGEELLTFSRYTNQVLDVAFDPNGKRVATTSDDSAVRIWDPSSGKELLVLPFKESEWVNAIAFSQDGTRIAATGGGTSKVWDATTGEVLFSGPLDHTGNPLDIALSADGTLAATGGEDQKAKVWESATGQVLYTLSGHIQPINSVTFSPDGTRLATAGYDYTVHIWDITPAKEALFIPFANSMTNSWSGWLSYSPDGKRILSDYTDPNARIWDAASGRELMQLSGHSTNAVNASYSSDGKWIATANDDNTIIVWDAETGKSRIKLAGHEDFIPQTSFSPDGNHLASASHDGRIIVWDLASGKAVFILHGPAAGPEGTAHSLSGFDSVAYSPDGKHIVSGDRDGNGAIWDANTGEKTFDLPGPQDNIRSVAYSPDGKFVALAGIIGNIRIWNVLNGEKSLDLRGHNAPVAAITFSPSGKWIATASWDGTARVWNAATGENLLNLPVDSRGAGGVSFSPDGKRLAVGGTSGIYVFVLPIDEVVALAKSHLTRTLTTEECQQYLHVDACPTNP